jgi:REP element-mobilizing transposase RayT
MKRLDLVGVAHHAVQRCNDRQPVFSKGDYQRYLWPFRALSLKFACRVHHCCRRG